MSAEGWDVKSLNFTGFLERDKLYEQYSVSDCLVFPSQVETWGLPISEYSVYNRPMLLADLPYAHETSSGSSFVAFFNPMNPQELAEKMKMTMNQNCSLFHSVGKVPIEPPVAIDWSSVIGLID